jgi:4-carboxymuconolactone decarboxylase
MTVRPDRPQRALAHPPETLSAAQEAAVAELVAGPRGECSGPFVPLLRSPEVMNHLQRAGLQLRFESVLEQRLVEFIVLLVARRWDQQFEWAMHSPLAIRAGLAIEVVEAVARAERPAGLDEPAAAVWELIDELHRTGQVSDATYSQGMAQLGEVGVVEAVVTAGYYATLAMIMNTARTSAPGPGAVPLPVGASSDS